MGCWLIEQQTIIQTTRLSDRHIKVVVSGRPTTVTHSGCPQCILAMQKYELLSATICIREKFSGQNGRMVHMYAQNPGLGLRVSQCMRSDWTVSWGGMHNPKPGSSKGRPVPFLIKRVGSLAFQINGRYGPVGLFSWSDVERGRSHLSLMCRRSPSFRLFSGSGL